MPHIHTQPGQHDITASAFIVIRGHPPVLLLHWHKKIHKWLQFGGHVELHEDPWMAVCHEIEEESGYDLKQLYVLQPKLRIKKSDHGTVTHPVPVSLNTHPFGEDETHFHTDIAYAFITDTFPSEHVQDGESNQLKPFTQAELEALSIDEIPGNVRDTAVFIMKYLLDAWEAVNMPQN